MVARQAVVRRALRGRLRRSQLLGCRAPRLPAERAIRARRRQHSDTTASMKMWHRRDEHYCDPGFEPKTKTVASRRAHKLSAPVGRALCRPGPQSPSSRPWRPTGVGQPQAAATSNRAGWRRSQPPGDEHSFGPGPASPQPSACRFGSDEERGDRTTSLDVVPRALPLGRRGRLVAEGCNYPISDEEVRMSTAIRKSLLAAMGDVPRAAMAVSRARPRQCPARGTSRSLALVGDQLGRGTTPLPDVASARRTDSPSVRTT